jgi:hypothetical protein
MPRQFFIQAMTNKKPSQLKLRYLALKKENRRLQNKILTLEAKMTTLQSELELRPPYELRKPSFRGSVASFKRRLRAATKAA